MICNSRVQEPLFVLPKEMANARSVGKAVSVCEWDYCEDVKRTRFEGKDTLGELSQSLSKCNWKNPMEVFTMHKEL